MKDGSCCHCRWIAPLILSVTMLLLLLLNLGVSMGGFGEFVANWWPGGVLLYALSGFCPCHKSCKA
ncbi:MAG: hypothetical protein O3B47_05840 [bacterium]|nr:hypothetical protein [bacterium]